MKPLPNTRITTNYTLYEIIEAMLPPQAVAMNWKNISQFRQSEWERHAAFLQALRNNINQKFRSKNDGKEIGLAITSGWRCKEWELFRKRSGNSQHCIGIAFDVQPTNCKPALAIGIMDHYHSIYNPIKGGHPGGYARSFPEYINGVPQKIGFLHFDFRPTPTRWTY